MTLHKQYRRNGNHNDNHRSQNNRQLASESNRITAPILCSPIYTDVHVVTFSYTIDTQLEDEESIQNSIRNLEKNSLAMLADGLLPCDVRRRLEGGGVGDLQHMDVVNEETNFNIDEAVISRIKNSDSSSEAIGSYSDMGVNGDSVDNESASSEHESMRHEASFLRPLGPLSNLLTQDGIDIRLLSSSRPELGIVGFSSWPSDDVSAQSQCFPTYNKTDTCTVVNGKLSVYLNPNDPNDNDVSLNQKEAVEDSVRYQMMQLMRSGVLDNGIDVLEHVRYLSPMVVMGDKYSNNYMGAAAASSSPQSNQSVSGFSVTQSILIIAACVAVIGAAGLILLFRVLLKKDEEFYTKPSKASTHRPDDDSMIPQWSKRGMRRNKETVLVSDKLHHQTKAGDVSASLDVGDVRIAMQHGKGCGERTESIGNSHREKNVDPGENYIVDPNSLASLPTTMRRVIITKKTPTASRKGSGLGAIDEDDESSQFGLQISSSSPRNWV